MKTKKFIFNDGILQKSVDATYIIYIENYGNYNHIQNQLLEYHPTNIVYILFNDSYDLINICLKIFNHANKKNYNNILILENNFIFSKKIKEIDHINNVNNSIINLENTDFIYLLGCIPYGQIPYDLYNYRVLSQSTHSIIYSKKNRLKTLMTDRKEIKDWNFFNNLNLNRITYYTPLCYQLLPEKSKIHDNILITMLSEVYHNIFKFLDLDLKIEPGTSIFYFLSKSSSLTIISLFLLVITNKIIQKDFISILGIIFILASLHRIILKKERQLEMKNFKVPNFFQYLVIIYEFVTGILLIYKTQYTNIALKILLLYLIYASIKIIILHKEKILLSYKDAWTFKPSMLSLTFHFYIIFIIVTLLK
jgi:hypothetical protein